MADKNTRKGRNGNKTFGRNKAWCESYRRRGQREKNKVLRIQKHLSKHPNDKASESRRVELKNHRFVG